MFTKPMRCTGPKRRGWAKTKGLGSWLGQNEGVRSTRASLGRGAPRWVEVAPERSARCPRRGPGVGCAARFASEAEGRASPAAALRRARTSASNCTSAARILAHHPPQIGRRGAIFVFVFVFVLATRCADHLLGFMSHTPILRMPLAAREHACNQQCGCMAQAAAVAACEARARGAVAHVITGTRS